MGRVGVHDSYPFNALGARQLPDQPSKSILFAEVFPIPGRVLGHQDQFLDTFFGQLLSFGDDRTKATTAKVTAHLRNETESTWPITTLSDFYKRVMRRSRQYTRC